LMDLLMPVMDGFEAVRRYRQHEAVSLWEGERKQLIVGVSANCDGNTKEAAIIAGMDSFMAKPFTLTRFFDALVSLELVTVPHDPS